MYAGQKALCAIADENGEHISVEISECTHNQNVYMNVFIYNKGSISIESSYGADGKYLTSQTDEFGYVTNYDYDDDGRLVKITDRQGIATEYEYDTMNRITEVLRANIAVGYTYTKDKLTAISTNGYNYELTYDVFGNLKITKVANRTIVTNNYAENNGKLTSSTYGNNQTISYSYDRFGRKSLKTTQDNQYTYVYNKMGSLAYIADNTGRKEYIYDVIDNLVEYRHNDYVSQFEYDDSNNLTKQTQTFSNVTKTYEYNYDRSGRINSLKIDDALQIYSYDRYSRLDNVTLKTANGEKTINYKYKNIGGTNHSNLISQEIDSGKRICYNYDENQNIIEIQENYQTVYEYEYDSLGQLVKEHDAKLNKSIGYTYDNNGNILTKTEYEYKTNNVIKTITYTYDTTWKDLLLSYNGRAITTDAIGNLLTYDGKTYSWRNGRELAGITAENKVISYMYNEEGIRTSKTINGVTTVYELSGTEVVYEKTGDTIIYYMYDGVGDILGFEYNGAKYYYKKNVLGDIVGIYDSALQEIVTYTYDSWGKLLSIKDTTGQEITSETHIGYINPYRYRSYRYDNESGLYYLQSRYYNAEWGRFISVDTIVSGVGNIVGNNLFAYCDNNPINKVDEDGNSAILALTKLATKFVATISVTLNAFKILAYFGGMDYLEHNKLFNSRELYGYAFWGQGNSRNYGTDSNISAALAKDKDFRGDVIKNISTNACYDSRSYLFKEEDLYYALHAVNYSGCAKQEDSKIVYSVTVTDTYNFDEWKPLDSMGNAANNLGYVLQNLYLIDPYEITIQVIFEE